MTLIPVKDQSGFFRDSETGAIINNDSNEYKSYMNNRDKLLSEKERIDKLESDIGDIKRMLQQLTNGQ
jgi:predicted transcriptional regulator|tara:strand:- start:808 stop:1011 length:204 start_codon:yes stop_codon:yes gene_type:complete